VKPDRPSPNSKLAVINRDIGKRPFFFIHTAISGDRNVIRKEAEKILKYEDPLIQIQRYEECKNKSDKTRIAETGTISKSRRPYSSNILGKHDFRNYIRHIFGTAHVLREVLT